MSNSDLTNLFLLTATFGFAAAAILYKRYAVPPGWPIGRIFHFHDDRIVFEAGFVMLATLIFAFQALRWWSPVVVALIGYLFALTITNVLRQWVQPVSALGAVLGVGLCVWHLFFA